MKTRKRAASTTNRGRILLKADEEQENGGWRDQDMKEALDISIRMIVGVRQRLVEDGFDVALIPHPGQGGKLFQQRMLEDHHVV